MQQNTLSLSTETSLENPNPMYRMIHEIYNSCSFTLAARDPSSFEEVNQQNECKMAMNEEMANIERNKTWALTTQPERRKPISLKCIFKSKFLSDGILYKRKAQLVA